MVSWSVWPAVTEVPWASVIAKDAAEAGTTVIASVVELGTPLAVAVIDWAVAFGSTIAPPALVTPLLKVSVVVPPNAMGAPVFEGTVAAVELGDGWPPAKVRSWSPV